MVWLPQPLPVNQSSQIDTKHSSLPLSLPSTCSIDKYHRGYDTMTDSQLSVVAQKLKHMSCGLRTILCIIMYMFSLLSVLSRVTLASTKVARLFLTYHPVKICTLNYFEHNWGLLKTCFLFLYQQPPITSALISSWKIPWEAVICLFMSSGTLRGTEVLLTFYWFEQGATCYLCSVPLKFSPNHGTLFHFISFTLKI